jgi:AcrR family transcriptional regulator
MTETSGPSRAAATRARLIDAPIDAFAATGFHGTTTRDITAAASTSPAALYVHHRSKEELLYLISKDGHEHTLDLVRAAIATSDDPAQALRRAAHDFAVHHARDHTVARIVNYELGALSPEHLVEIRGIRHAIEGDIRRLVARGVAAGRFDVADPAIAAAAVLSLGIDLARWYQDGGRWTPEQIGHHYADMALRIVGASNVGG